MAGPIYNPPMPYLAPIFGGMFSGKMVSIQGTSHTSATRFCVNLQCGPNVNPRDDIALHMDVRFSQSAIVRNSLTMQQWGPEEAYGPFPFQRGQPFDIKIMADPNCFKIALNGLHFAEFRHRMPLERVSYLAIDGDTILSCIQFEGGSPMSGGYAPQVGFAGAPATGYMPSVSPIPYAAGYGQPVGPSPYPVTSGMYPMGHVPPPGRSGAAYPMQTYPGSMLTPFPQTTTAYLTPKQMKKQMKKQKKNSPFHSPHISPRHSPMHSPLHSRSPAIPIIGGAAAGMLGAGLMHRGFGKHKHKHKFFKHKFKGFKHKHKHFHHGFHGFGHHSSSSSSSEEE